MKNKEYFKKLCKVLIWPIIFVIGQVFIQYIFVAIYNKKEFNNLTKSQFLKYINTNEYKDKLNTYITSDKIVLLMLLILCIIFIPILFKQFKKYKSKSKLSIEALVVPILLGISISLIYNISIFNLNNIVFFTHNYDVNNKSLMITVMSSAILGPILEELIFRGIIYNKLKEFNKPIRAIVLQSIIFALFHDDILNAIYAFMAGFMFTYVYEKYNNLISSIVLHISLNLTIVLMFNIIIKNNIILNFSLVIISILTLLILNNSIKKDI